MAELVGCSRILVVDDQATHLGALCDILGHYQFEAVGCATGAAALAQLRSDPFDLLLTDLVMPNVDGLALLEAAREVDPHMACIIMTGEGTVDTAVKAMKIGAFDYVIKPFKAATLLPVLRRALESRRLRLQNLALEAALRDRVDELGRLNVVLAAAHREAERANQAKSVFLSSMSHELRTPLNSILGFAQILASNKFPKGAVDSQRFAENIVQSGRHLLALVNEVLDLSRIESGTVTLQIAPTPLAPVLAEAYALVAPLTQANQISLQPADGAELVLCADAVRLKQILVNLLSNAIKYNRERGKVSVHCTHYNGTASIAITDTGLGLTHAQLASIFQPFSRAGRENSDIEGTGLGLVISRRLLEGMQGSITVDSQPGVGSTFRIDLPLPDGSAACRGSRQVCVGSL